MRSVGVIDAPSVRAGSHVCWAFEDPEAFRDAARAFLAEGLARGEQLVYVADAPEEQMRADAASIAALDDLVDTGRLLLRPVSQLYEGRPVLDPSAQVHAYRRLVEAAVAEGYSGLRVAADATALVTDPCTRRRFVEYEVAVDHLMSVEPMTAMCAYDHTRLGPAVAELLAVHPLTHGANRERLGFSAFHDGGDLHLVGEIDAATTDLFRAVLASVERSTDTEPVIDFGELTFMDVAGLTQLWRLSSRLEAAGRSLRVTRASEIVKRCCEVLHFESLSRALGDG